MYKYMKEQENFILNKVNMEDYDYDWLLQYFKTQIEFVSQERLIHLIVTLFFSLLLIAAIIISYIIPNTPLILLDLILLVLDTFYIVHYYRLENGLQRWYEIYSNLKRDGS
jgi:hypothetical protein